MHLRFLLQRDQDETGVSGTGVVAEGVWWPDGDVVALRWTSDWPTSVVFHDRGLESVEAIHGHNGKTRIVWLDRDQSDYRCICGVGAGEQADCPLHGARRG